MNTSNRLQTTATPAPPEAQPPRSGGATARLSILCRRCPRSLRRPSLVAALTLLSAACAGEEPSSEVCAWLDAAAAQSEPTRTDNGAGERGSSPNELSGAETRLKALSINGFSANGLGLNGLGVNGLGVNGLGVNGLGVNGLQLNGLRLAGEIDDDADGAAPRDAALAYLRYAVSCALRADQSVSVTADDGAHVLTGALGLAPEWLERELDGREERWMSACLLAHVNPSGERVAISVRASGVVGAEPLEQDVFSVHEGAFFGSLAQGKRFSCQAEPADAALAASADRSDRTCTDTGSDCAVVSLGACDGICDEYDPETGYGRCRADGETYSEVLNVYLRSDALLEACSADQG